METKRHQNLGVSIVKRLKVEPARMMKRKAPDENEYARNDLFFFKSIAYEQRAYPVVCRESKNYKND